MANLFIPFLNPIKYHELNPVELPQYLSKSIEKYSYLETIEEWEQGFDYPQLWQKSDTIVQQLTSGYGPVNMKVIDKDGRIYLDTNFTQVIQNKRKPGEWVYQKSTSLSAFDKGYYFLKLTVGSSSPTILISEPIFICDEIPYSVLLEYKHPTYYGDVYFETGISFFIRVLGKIKLKTVSSNDTIYEDQPLNETLIRSYPFDVWTLQIGGSWGIPDYLIRRINWLFGCAFTYVDGTRYTKNSGAKFEEKAFDDYTLRGWTIELRETLARASQVYDGGTQTNGPVTIIAALDTHGFADSDTGNEVLILDIT